MGVEQTTYVAKLEADVKRLAALAQAQQQTLSKIELVCQRHNHAGVNTGAHALAASILSTIASSRGS